MLIPTGVSQLGLSGHPGKEQGRLWCGVTKPSNVVFYMYMYVDPLMGQAALHVPPQQQAATALKIPVIAYRIVPFCLQPSLKESMALLHSRQRHNCP